MFYAPGEAEAVCAALNRAGCVDAAASSDSDTLLYGAETLLQSLKLSVRGPPRGLGRVQWRARAVGEVALSCASRVPGGSIKKVGSLHRRCS